MGGVRQIQRVTAAMIADMVSAELADVPPLPEAVVPAAGSMPKASRADHKHARLASVGAQPEQLLNGSGELAITFTREFLAVTPPTVLCSEIEANDYASVTFKTKSYTFKAGDLTIIVGCVIKGKRRRALPTIAPLSTGLVLILNLVNALNTLLSGLNQFLPETDASGARFSYVAFASSQPVP